MLAGRAGVRGLVHAARHAREQGDRGAGRHQRLHHRPLPRHEDHRGRRQVSCSCSVLIENTFNIYTTPRQSLTAQILSEDFSQAIECI